MPEGSFAKNDLLPSLHIEDPKTDLIRKPHQEPFDILSQYSCLYFMNRHIWAELAEILMLLVIINYR
jgi:hypothetical protein